MSRETPNTTSLVDMPTPSRVFKGWAVVDEADVPVIEPWEDRILSAGTKRSRSQTQRYGNEIRANGGLPEKKKVIRPKFKIAHDQPQTTRIQVGGRVRTKDYNNLEREVNRLKIQNDLLAVAESEETQRLKAEVKRLEKLNAEQNRRIHRLKSDAVSSATSDNRQDESETIKLKDRRIQQQNVTIKDLQFNLNSALRFDDLLAAMQEELPTAITDFNHEMKAIELSVLRIAELLSSCFHDQASSTIQIHPDLGDLANEAIHDMRLLSSMPSLALRALLFRIIRDQILYSKIWPALHVEGCMLRTYQKAIQQISTDELFVSFHRAAFACMVNDSEFRKCFVDAHVEELQTYIMRLLDPLLEPTAIKLKEFDIIRELKALLFQVFSFRSQIFPTNGLRYEVVQIKPGSRFDPSTMEAQDSAGNNISVPIDGTTRLIKFCVHGSIVAHTVTESSYVPLKIKDLGQPFLQVPSVNKGRNTVDEKKTTTAGELVSEIIADELKRVKKDLIRNFYP